ncbi:MAG: beta-propeller domain-containing protein [Lachnospirales bacterium]
MNNKMVLNIMIAYFVILSIVLVYQLTRLNDNIGAVPSNNDAVQTEDRLSTAVVFYNDSPVILSNKRQLLLDRTNPSYTPVIKDDMAYLPASFYNTCYGANVSVSKSSCAATIRLDNKALVCDSNENILVDSSNEKKLKTKTKPIICNNTVYVPCDVFAEAYQKELYIYENMGILSTSEFTEEDNLFLDGLVSQVNDLPYVVNEENLKSIANISGTDDIFANLEKKRESFEKEEDLTPVKLLNSSNSPILANDGDHIFYGSTGKVEVLLNGEETTKIAEIPTPDTFTAKKLILEDKKLVVIGNNTSSEFNRPKDIHRGNVSTDIYVYNVADTNNIKSIRSYSVSGYYQNGVLVGDFLYLLSKNTVYGLYNNNKFNPPAFYDSTFGGEEIGFDKIQYFPEIGSDDVTVFSAVNISDQKAKPNVKAFVGAGDNTYLADNNFYISKDRYTAFEDYDSVENNCIYRYTFGNGVLSFNNKTLILGTFINPLAVSEYNGYLRVVTKYTDSKNNNNKVCNVYVLNNNLEICGQANQVANNDDISSALFENNVIYLMPSEVGGNIYTIDIENPTLPKGKGAFKLTDGNMVMYNYDESTIITVDDGGEVLKLCMYDISQPDLPKLLFSQELGATESITTPLFNSSKGFLFDKERNIMVIPVKINGSNIFEGAYCYNVYKDEGIVRIGTVMANNLTADCITKGKLMMFSNDKVMISNINDVKVQTAIEFKKSA